MKDTVALVTGGASGLGEACVRLIVGNGGRAVIMDLDDDKGPAVAEDLRASAVFCKTDVCSEGDVKAAVDKAVETFGRVNALVNCAGIGIPAKVVDKDGPMPLNLFNRTVQVNLVGTFNVIRLAAAAMMGNPPTAEGERGVIINTASVAAFEGQIGQSAYAASKAGIAGMTICMAREFAGQGIRVLTIAPGFFDTPMLQSLPEKVREAMGRMMPFPKRLGRPDEFAALAGHIIENTMLNGETIRLDGAIRMAPR